MGQESSRCAGNGNAMYDDLSKYVRLWVGLLVVQCVVHTKGLVVYEHHSDSFDWDDSRQSSSKDNPIPDPSKLATTAKAMFVGTMYPKYSAIILLPIKPKTKATAGSRYFRSVAALLNTVYRLRSPIMAKILDENTTRGFYEQDDVSSE